jgi:hypothetical protein
MTAPRGAREDAGGIARRAELERRRPTAVLPAIPRFVRRHPAEVVAGGALTLGTIAAVVIVILAVAHP